MFRTLAIPSNVCICRCQPLDRSFWTDSSPSGSYGMSDGATIILEHWPV
jgi:hypothetical protein